MKKLQEVLLQTFSETAAPKEETSNIEYLQLFLDAKRIEGCSVRTVPHKFRRTMATRAIDKGMPIEQEKG